MPRIEALGLNHQVRSCMDDVVNKSQQTGKGKQKKSIKEDHEDYVRTEDVAMESDHDRKLKGEGNINIESSKSPYMKVVTSYS